jgi:hypothetical protein
MVRKGLPMAVFGAGALVWGVLTVASAMAQDHSGPILVSHGGSRSHMPIHSIDQFVRMSRQDLDRLYQRCGVGTIPEGKARGKVIFFPGTALAPPTSRITRVLWQGKVFHGADSTAVNKFFGLKVIKANVSYGESWMDGRPSIILDYRETSRLYAGYSTAFCVQALNPPSEAEM